MALLFASTVLAILLQPAAAPTTEPDAVPEITPEDYRNFGR